MFNLLKNILLIFLFLEIICFILVVKWLGFGIALLLLLVPSMLGLSLIRKASESTALLAQQLQVGAWQEIANTRYLLAGLLLVVPGFLTDALGLLCLAPLVHRKVLDRFQQKKHYSANDHCYEGQQAAEPKSTRIIEGEFWREEDKDIK